MLSQPIYVRVCLGLDAKHFTNVARHHPTPVPIRPLLTRESAENAHGAAKYLENACTHAAHSTSPVMGVQGTRFISGKLRDVTPSYNKTQRGKAWRKCLLSTTTVPKIEADTFLKGECCICHLPCKRRVGQTLFFSFANMPERRLS